MSVKARLSPEEGMHSIMLEDQAFMMNNGLFYER